MQFIDRVSVTDEGEVTDNDKYYLNRDRKAEEESYEGYYAVVSNIDDDACDIININLNRWKTEECFCIMKTEFKSQPAYVILDENIKAHFLTCFLALVVYWYLEKKLDYQ